MRIPSADAGKLSGLGIHPRKAFDYGAFQWLELNAADVDRMQKEGLRFELQSVSYELTLGEQRFDPLKSPPRFEQGWGPTAHSGKDLQLVQFFAPIQQDWLEMLQAQGLEVVQYIYPFTYVVWGDADALSSVTREQVVRWAGPFAPAYRVLPAWRALGKETVNVHVLIYRGADVGQLVAQIEALGGKSTGRRVLNDTWEMVGFALAGDQIRAAARLPGVYSIQPVHTDGGPRGEMSNQINAGNYDGSNQAFPGYLDWLDSVGVHGTGVIIANVDGGVQDNHPDLVNRLIPCTGVTCGGSATDGHGTHTAGIMAADGSSGVTDQYGFLRGLGMAPGANLVEQVYFPWYTQPGGMLLLMTDSYNNGASLSGNSWGPSGTPKGYDDDTLQVDIGVRDADPEAPGNQPLTYVLSFMNGYGGTSSQGTPDEAKNIFTIGSTKMQNSNGSQILDINDLSSNTAHGPALDGRTIPHMVAPGCNVDSTYSGSSYSLLCGTSMASPHVSGAVALFIEYYRNLTAQSTGRLADPSPALVKAAFLPVAHDLAGFDDADGFPLGHPFDSKQGWGRMDTDAVVNPQVAVEYFDNPMVFDNTGEEWVQTLAPADPTQPVRMMLVWTDAPGHGLGGSTPAWNNNLDLIVEADGNTYHGNDFGPDGWSQAGGSADFMNNTEGVFLGPIPPGSFTIRVVASDINSDGVPNQGDTTDQDFALVCYNCGPSAADFTLSASPAQQTVCTPEDALYDVSVGSVLGYNDAVTLSVLGVPAGASSSFSVNGQTAPFDSVLTIGNTGAAAAGSYEMDIVGIAPTSTHTTTVNLTLFTAVPGIPTPLSPADGASGVPLVPEFTWSPAADATSYLLEVAEDPGFTNVVYSAVVEETSHLMDGALAPVTSYYWRVRASNICGEGENSATFSFTTADVPPILLVDDDDNSPDVQSSYTAALDGLGLAYDIWDTGNSDNEPSAAELSPYDVVIWFTGDEYGGSAGPGSAGEAALAAWLDNGGCFFISSQDYHWDRGLTNFMSTYLGTAAVTDDSGNYSAVSGSGSLYGGLGPYPLSYPFSDYSDILNPDGTAELAFLGDNSNPAGVNKNAGGYQTTFLGFPLEAMTLGDRQEVLNTFLNACGAAQNLLRVSRIQLKLLQGGNAVGTRIFVVDGSDLPVEGAAVTFEWTLPDGTKVPRTRVTNPLGRVQNRAPDAGPGWYIVKVVDVTKAGYTWTGGDVIKRRIFRP